MRRIRLALWLAMIVVLAGYYMCGLALQRGIPVPSLVYWFFFLAIPSLALLLVSENESRNVALLLMVAAAVYSMYFLQSHTLYSPGRDTQFELQNVVLIRDTGRWVAGMGTSMATEHSVHPAMHILLAAFSETTAIPLSQVMFIIPWLKGIGVALFFYLLARTFLSNNRAAFLASIVYLGCFSPLLEPHREAYAIVLFMGGLWLITSRKRGPEFKVLFLLLVSALAMSHHFTAYIFVIISLALYLVAESRNWILQPYYPIVAVFAWINFASLSVALGYSEKFLNAIDMVLTLKFPSVPTMAAASYFYEPFELIIMFAGPLLVGLLALKPFLSLLRSKRRSSLLTLTLVLGILLVIALAFYWTGTYSNATYRIWGFAYIPLSILAAGFVWQSRARTTVKLSISILVVALLFASMNLSSLSGIKKWYVPRGYMESYVVSDSMINTGLWSKEYANGSFFGDDLAFSMIGSWGLKQMDSYNYSRWYQTKNNEILKDYDFLAFSPLDRVTYSDTFRTLTDPFALLPMNLSIIYSSGDFVIYTNR
jgi:hypothetical protein